MADATRPRGGLDHLPEARIVAADPATLHIAPVPDRGLLWLRVRPDDPPAMAAIAGALGASLPVSPNTRAALPDGHASWLGPDEWLVDVDATRAEPIRVALEDALRSHHALLVAIGDGRTILAVRGTAAIDVLRKGCPLDLHPRAFPRDACARTVLGRVGVFVACIEPGATYHVVVDRSYADHLWRWLADAARAFAETRQTPA